MELWETFLQVAFQSDTILYEHHDGISLQQWWEEGIQEVVVHRLETYEHDIYQWHGSR